MSQLASLIAQGRGSCVAENSQSVLGDKEFFRTVIVCAHAHASPPAPPFPPLFERRECPCPCNTLPESLPPSLPLQTAPASARAPPATDRQKTCQCRRWRSPCRRSAVASWSQQYHGARSPTPASPRLFCHLLRTSHSPRERD